MSNTPPPSFITNKKISVSVPGTTANIGPAFDIAGIALSCAITLTVHAADKFSLTLSGLGSDHPEVSNPEMNMVVVGCSKMLDELQVPQDKRPPLAWTIHSDVPTKAGCGSSSAAVVAGMVAALGLTGTTSLNLDELLALAEKIEGHPDNAAPAIFGGMQLVIKTPTLRVQRVPLPPSLRIVIFTPLKEMKASTTANRGLVKQQVAMADAIHNIGRTAVLLVSLMTNDKDGLMKFCGEEKFHQDARADALYPHYRRCVAAAMQNGACHAFMSGAGPSCAAFVIGDQSDQIAKVVGAAMEKAALNAGNQEDGKEAIEGISRILTVQEKSVEVVVSDI